MPCSAGSTLLDVSQSNTDLNQYLPFTCSGNMSCSTCHVYIPDEEAYRNHLSEEEGGQLPEEEIDMLEMAGGYVEGKSRLGCNLKIREEGVDIEIPEELVDYWN